LSVTAIDDATISLFREGAMRAWFSIFLLCICNEVLAQQNPPPRLIPIGCNFDGGLAWLALGRASADPELNSFRVEISDVDLESVEATISPSKMDMFMPYGLGPVVGPMNVASISISPRYIHGVSNGNIVTIRFNLSPYSTLSEFLEPASISYILVLNNKSTGCRR
jgi:hypothetical protein